MPTRLRRAVESKLNRDPYAAYLEFVRLDEGYANRDEALHFLREQVSGNTDDTLAFLFDQLVYLPGDLLYKIDRAGMQHGLEGRVPFLDIPFFSYVRSLPAGERQGGGASGKELLKGLLRKHLPSNLVDRPKQGFSISLKTLQKLPPEVLHEAFKRAYTERALIPLPVPLLKRLSEDEAFRLDFIKTHAQLSYVLLMWAGWREKFTI